jgi:RNA polymerase sigma factor (sigma-70 family)
MATAPDERDDAALLGACRAGDATAWRALVQRYQRLVYAIVRRAGLDEASAADVFQEVFARLLAHLGRLNDPSRVQAWIVTTAKREVLHRLAQLRREPPLDNRRDDEEGEPPEHQLEDPTPLPDELLSQLQQLDRLRSAFDRLDPRCRDLLSALYREDPPPSYETLATRLSVPLGSVGPTRARCLDKLRRTVEAP